MRIHHSYSSRWSRLKYLEVQTANTAFVHRHETVNFSHVNVTIYTEIPVGDRGSAKFRKLEEESLIYNDFKDEVLNLILTGWRPFWPSPLPRPTVFFYNFFCNLYASKLCMQNAYMQNIFAKCIFWQILGFLPLLFLMKSTRSHSNPLIIPACLQCRAYSRNLGQR